MSRRSLLKSCVAVTGTALLPNAVRARQEFDPRPGPWRTYEVVTRVELRRPTGTTRVWVPLPSMDEPSWVASLGEHFTGNYSAARVVSDGRYGARMLAAEWSPGEKSPVLVVASRAAVRDREVDFARPHLAIGIDTATRRFYTAATELVPTDGIVRRTAHDVTRGVRSEMAKARAIYEWVVENTVREPTTRGCGVGDVKAMLETGNLGGKCADLNALYVGLARACGLPARDVYGLRVAPSQFGYKSLGAGTSDVTRAQHCRAEVWLDGYGWVPVDPADVRKVMLEEPPGKLAIQDPKVVQVRRRLFGSWEMNWVPYNVAHDVRLPGSAGVPVGFLMYPQAESSAGRFDALDPENFRYTITSRIVPA